MITNYKVIEKRTEKSGLLIFLIIIFIAIMFSCKSSINVGDITWNDDSPEKYNRLVFNRAGFSLPVGWIFHLPFIEDKDDIVLRFRNPAGTINGTYESINFNVPIPGQNLAEYYINEILKDYDDKKIINEKFNNKEVFIIMASAKDNNMEHIIGFYPDGKHVDVIEMIKESGNMNSNPQDVFYIIKNFKNEKPGTCSRIISDCIGFHCHDNSWLWGGDFNKGIYIQGKIAGKNCLVGICETDAENTETFFKDIKNFDIPLFDADFFINNWKIKTKGTGHRESDGFMKLYYILGYKEKSYCIYTSIDNEGLKIKPEDIHKQPEINDLFLFNILFD